MRPLFHCPNQPPRRVPSLTQNRVRATSLPPSLPLLPPHRRLLPSLRMGHQGAVGRLVRCVYGPSSAPPNTSGLSLQYPFPCKFDLTGHPTKLRGRQCQDRLLCRFKQDADIWRFGLQLLECDKCIYVFQLLGSNKCAFMFLISHLQL